MKLVILATLLLSAAAALESAGLEDRPRSTRKRISRPSKAAGVEMRTSEYSVSTGIPTEQRSKAALTRAPGLRRRGEGVEAIKMLPRQEPKASDFFECTNPKPSPSPAHCKVIVDQVLSTDDELIIAPNSCLVFSYKTCQAFFCSLCQTLDTTTQFIGSQLDTAEALCVENGQAGTIVGEDAPQWDAGFTYAGQGLPTFDVC